MVDIDMNNKTTEKSMNNGFVIWLTGLPKSGKTELATKLTSELTQIGFDVEFINSGKLRKTPIGQTLGFSKTDRKTNLLRHAITADLLIRNGMVAIVSAVSPYRDIREQIRTQLKSFFEVHVATPKQACIERDTTGIWKKALAGKIPNFTGVNDPYEEPLSPDAIVDLEKQSVENACQHIIAELRRSMTITQFQVKSQSAEQEIADRLSALGYVVELEDVG